MEKNNGRKWTIAAFAFVCVALCGLTVAFAALSKTLDIQPAVEVLASDWGIEFQNVVMTKTGDATANSVGEGLIVNVTIIKDMDIQLRTPGDSVTYTFDVVNTGDIDAKLSSFTMPQIVPATCSADETADAELVCANLDYTLVYSGELDPAKGDTPTTLNSDLLHGTSREMKLTITYTTGGTDVPTGDVTLSGLDIALPYVQK